MSPRNMVICLGGGGVLFVPPARAGDSWQHAVDMEKNPPGQFFFSPSEFGSLGALSAFLQQCVRFLLKRGRLSD